jgi:hypothetical protein
MSLLTVLRSGVKIANNVTKPLQTIVQYQMATKTFTSEKGATATLAAPVPLHAIVDYKSNQVRTRDGVLTASRCTITLLDIDEVVKATKGRGVTVDDKFILPGGETGSTLDVTGFVDAGTGHPIATQVMFG